MMAPKQVIVALTKKLIAEGEKLHLTEQKRKISAVRTVTCVDFQGYHKWRSSCRVLVMNLGLFAEPFREILAESGKENYLSNVKSMLGALGSVLESVESGQLARFEDLVFAEAFGNLVEQGEYLMGKSYHLAAGVIFRAVLEERLRRLCEVNGVETGKDRPTISDFNSALYKANVYDKVEMKSVDTMAAIGNSAAHAADDFVPDQVKQFHSNLISFLARLSVNT